ncbi:polyphosphate kinase 2 family protein [Cryomorphaceae bacterium 1068]|nr:polyphosphate kinase 2 family protein [Cryomorphaceae bacterium 1068]
MIDSSNLSSQFQVPTDGSFVLSDHHSTWSAPLGIESLTGKELKKAAKKFLKENLKQLQEAQELLWASNRRSMLLIFQAMDAAGKDSTIKHVMTGINPQGVSVTSFKQPSKEELEHNFLWRYWNKMPERGQIGIFNRSYYEEVLVVKVHPEILDARPLPRGPRGTEFWEARYEDINTMERHLFRSGKVILKFFLNVSKEEQKKRFIDRLSIPEKHWKFTESDVQERQHWDRYMQAFEEAIKATSTEWAPWHVIPADNKWKMRGLVSSIITEKILSLNLEFPQVSEDEKARLQEIKKKLENE